MNYDNLTKEELIEKIEELKILNKELLKEVEQGEDVNLCWAGNLGRWYWNVKTNNVVFDSRKMKNLGYTEEETPYEVGHDFFKDKIHDDDRSKVIQCMKDHLSGKTDSYELEYRIKGKDGEYYWYFDSGKITQYSDKGEPVLISGFVFDISKRKELEDSIKEYNEVLLEKSMTDGLTNLNNYESIIERLKIEIALLCNLKQPLSIAIMNIDNFSRVNASKGYVAGDKTLMEIAALIGKTVRNTDAIGRYSGDGFLIIYENTNLEEAKNITEEIRKTIEDYSFAKSGKVTISGGVCEYQGGKKKDFLRSANSNLNKAKRQGKNQIV